MEKFKYFKREEVSKLPKNSGVYCFKNKEVLYIGKAANIQERVKNHFQNPGFKENVFLNKAKKIGFVKTDSEIEALILEAKLIKKYQPKYNVMWRDDKNYFFVGITKENFPCVFITHQLVSKLKINYIGPFVDGKVLKQTLKFLRKVFPFRSCKILPKKPCLWYQLDRCSAPCLLKSRLGTQVPSAFAKIRKESQDNVKNIFKILKGEKNEVLKNLEKEMKKEAKSRQFEKASKIRDKIYALKRVMSHSKILEREQKTEEWKETEKKLKKTLKVKKNLLRIEAYDVSNIQGLEATGSMVTFIKGEPSKDFYRKFKIETAGKPNDVAMLKEIIKRRLKHKEWPYPDLILIDGGKAQLNAVLKTKNSLPASATPARHADASRAGWPKALQAGKQRIKNITVVAIAKKKNELYIENQKKPFSLKKLPREIFNLILQLRDEAHRFALAYHKKLREIDLKENF